MDTKERILKLAIGGSVNSRKDLKEAQAQYELALAAMDQNNPATAALQDQAAMYLQSVQNVSSADPGSNKRARHRSAEAYRNATRMLTGEFNMASTVNPYTGSGSRRGGYADADNIAVDYMIKNGARQGGYYQGGASQSNGLQELFEFIWNKGLTGVPMDSEQDLKTRVLNYANTLKNNIDEAEGYKSRNAVTSGRWDASHIGQLDGIISGLNNGTISEEKAYNMLNPIAQYYGETKDHWDQWFSDALPLLTQAEKNHKELLKNKYTDYELTEAEKAALGDFDLSSVKFMKDSNEDLYAFDKNWNKLTGLKHINLNDGDYYGHGLFSVGDEGKVFLGDTSGINEGHWGNEAFGNLKSKMYSDYNDKYVAHTFNTGDDYIESNLVNEFIRTSGLSNVSYADVSALFGNSAPVIAYNPDGSEVQQGKFGELKNYKNLKYRWQLPDGTYKEGTFDDAKASLGGFSLKGFEGQKADETGAIYGLNNIFDGIEGVSRDTNFRPYSGKRMLAATAAGAGVGSWGGWIGAGIGALIGGGSELIAQWWNNSTIGEHPQDFFKAALIALESPNKELDLPGADMSIVNGMTGSEFINHLGGRQKVIATLAQFVNEGELEVPEKLKKTFLDLRRQYFKAHKDELSDKVYKHEDGGILKAASGAQFYENENTPQHVNDWHDRFGKSKEVQKEEKDIEKAKADGYDDVNLWRADKNTKLTAADTMRIGAIAADVTSIVASFAPGYGSVVAEATGIGSFAANTVADFIDPSVTAGEVLKNAAIGAGLAAVSFIPGSKIPTTLAKVAKYAPKIMLAAGALGIAMDESTHNTFKKITDGKEKLNTQDWKNLAHVMMLVSAGTRGGRRAYEKHAAKSDFIKPGDKVGIFRNGEQVGELTKEQQEGYNAALKLAKEGKSKEAAKALADLKIKIGDSELTEETAAKFITQHTSKFSEIRHLGDKGDIDFKIKKLEGDIDYEVAAAAFEKESAGAKYGWLRNRPTWRQLGIMDALEIKPEGTIGGTAGVAKALRDRGIVSPKVTQSENIIAIKDQLKVDIPTEEAQKIEFINSLKNKVTNLTDAELESLIADYKGNSDKHSYSGIAIKAIRDTSGKIEKFDISDSSGKQIGKDSWSLDGFIKALMSKKLSLRKQGGQINYNKLRK